MMTGNADNTGQIAFPGNTDPAAHTLQIQISPSAAGSLFSALDYLTTFPYGCTEQTMSSFLPNLIVAQAAKQLHLEARIDQATLNAKIDAGLTRLGDFQHADGGWGWWKEDDSQVFMTAYVVSGLAQANTAGRLKLSPNLSQGVKFLQTTLRKHPRMLPELRAYVLYALAETYASTQYVGVDLNLLKSSLDASYDRRNDLSAQGLAFTGLAMLRLKDARAAELAKLLEQKATVSFGQASWPSTRNQLLDIDYDAGVESTAFALKFLAAADPESPLLPQAAQWLVVNRSDGYWWSSTEQTAFAIYGLTGYLAVSRELAADTDVEVFLNGVSVAQRHFSHDDAVQGAAISLALDAAHLRPRANAVRIVIRGNGRVYWSTQAGYYSTARGSYQKGSLSLSIARDYSLLVPTTKDGKIVYRLQPLAGPVAQGDILAVHLGVTGSPQKYLLIEDPIPSGAEFLQNTSSYNIDQRPNSWDWWYTRQEFHDDRAAIFSTTFDGRHESFYLLKVVNPGSFDISPARVAPMYQPGVQATTDPLHLDVKEAGQ